MSESSLLSSTMNFGVMADLILLKVTLGGSCFCISRTASIPPSEAGLSRSRAFGCCFRVGLRLVAVSLADSDDECLDLAAAWSSVRCILSRMELQVCRRIASLVEKVCLHWDLQRRSGPSGRFAWTCCFGPELTFALTGGVDPLTGGVEVLEKSDMSESVSSSTLADLFVWT